MNAEASSAQGVECLRDLAAKQAICEQLYAYCRSVDRLDLALGHGVFHEDSYADYGADVYQGPGRGAIDKICRDHQHLTSHSHQISNILIDLDGDCAGSESYVTATMRLVRDGKEHQIVVRGRYFDSWERHDGRWVILHRQVACDHDEIREVTSLRGTSRSSRDESDPSYRILRRGP